MRLFFVPFVIKEHEGKLTKKRSFYRVMLYNMNTQSAIGRLQIADCYVITENSKPLQVPYGKWAGLLQKVFVLYERFFSLK